jgi:hypothetical protein
MSGTALSWIHIKQTRDIMRIIFLDVFHACIQPVCASSSCSMICNGLLCSVRSCMSASLPRWCVAASHMLLLLLLL